MEAWLGTERMMEGDEGVRQSLENWEERAWIPEPVCTIPFLGDVDLGTG